MLVLRGSRGMCPFLLCLSAELSPSLIGILHVSSFNLCAMRADVPILQMRELELTEVKLTQAVFEPVSLQNASSFLCQETSFRMII